MNKYELAVVLSAKLEEDERAAAIEKIQGYITRFGGTVTNIDEWGKKKLAYEIQKMKEAFYYFIQFDGKPCPHHGAGDPLFVRKAGSLDRTEQE